VALRLPEFASDAVRCDAIGDADLPAGELSYWLVPAARGHGLAGAAVRLMMNSIVSATELRSVVLDIEPGNAPSVRLAERLGAERRSPSRVEVDRTGKPRELVVFVLTVRPLGRLSVSATPGPTALSPRARCGSGSSGCGD
jgi:RimJ/RimL family protein N-acetyltransferase